MNKVKSICYIALVSCVALMFSYIEYFLPLPITVPGIKLGLANGAVIFAMYVLNSKSAIFVCIIRIFLSALLFQGLVPMIYSFAGAFLSLCLMILLKCTNKFSVVTVSTVGAMAHNIGQICAAALILKSVHIFSYLPILLISGFVFGIIIGFLSGKIIKIMGCKKC